MTKRKINPLTTLIITALLILAVILTYMLVISLADERVTERRELAIEQLSSLSPVTENRTYRLTCYNLGFGIYDSDYSSLFVHQTLKGLPVHGKMVKGESLKKTVENIDHSIKTLKDIDADIILLQQVDRASTRSFNLNQKQRITEAFPEYCTSYASSVHSPYLLYPVTSPTGSRDAGIMTLSRIPVASATQIPLSDTRVFPDKYRLRGCTLSMSRLPAENGKTLVVLNLDIPAAFDESDYQNSIEIIKKIAEKEIALDNYVIAAGNWGASLKDEDNQMGHSGMKELDPDMFRGLLSAVTIENNLCTERTLAIPYTPLISSQAQTDLLFVSENIEASASVTQTGFAHSNHLPVTMRFTLK